MSTQSIYLEKALPIKIIFGKFVLKRSPILSNHLKSNHLFNLFNFHNISCISLFLLLFYIQDSFIIYYLCSIFLSIYKESLKIQYLINQDQTQNYQSFLVRQSTTQIAMEQIKPTNLKNNVSKTFALTLTNSSKLQSNYNNDFLNQVKCSSKNKATQVCCDKSCENMAFMCKDQDCKCAQKHQECVKFSLKKIVQKIQAKVLDLTPLIQEHNIYIDNCIDKLIQQASKIKNSFQEFVNSSLKYCQLTFDQGKILQVLQKSLTQNKNIQGKRFYMIHKNLFDKQKKQIEFNIQQQKKRICSLWKSFQKQSLGTLQKIELKIYQSQYIDQNFDMKKNVQEQKITRVQSKKQLMWMFESVTQSKRSHYQDNFNPNRTARK